jgi:hypothetical protein
VLRGSCAGRCSSWGYSRSVCRVRCALSGTCVHYAKWQRVSGDLKLHRQCWGRGMLLGSATAGQYATLQSPWCVLWGRYSFCRMAGRGLGGLQLRLSTPGVSGAVIHLASGLRWPTADPHDMGFTRGTSGTALQTFAECRPAGSSFLAVITETSCGSCYICEVLVIHHCPEKQFGSLWISKGASVAHLLNQLRPVRKCIKGKSGMRAAENDLPASSTTRCNGLQSRSRDCCIVKCCCLSASAELAEDTSGVSSTLNSQRYILALLTFSMELSPFDVCISVCIFGWH